MFFGNLIFAIIALKFCGNHLNNLYTDCILLYLNFEILYTCSYVVIKAIFKKDDHQRFS